LCNVASCWIYTYIGILLGAHLILHISRIRVKYLHGLKRGKFIITFTARFVGIFTFYLYTVELWCDQWEIYFESCGTRLVFWVELRCLHLTGRIGVNCEIFVRFAASVLWNECLASKYWRSSSSHLAAVFG
jgi:hypothetical protein